MTFMDLAAERYSCRKFSNKPVEADKLAQVLEAVRIAPTAKNLQPEHVYVLQSEDALAKVDALTHCRYGAPMVLLFTYNIEEDWRNPLEKGIRSGVEDVSIAATQAMLQASELGLATCWCNYYPNTKLEQSLGLPAEQRSVVLMPLGYADASAHPAHLHAESKDLKDLVSYL